MEPLARVAKLTLRILPGHCEEHRAADAVMDCFAHRTALCAEPVARNDGLKIAHAMGAIH